MKSTLAGADVLCLHSSASSGRQWLALAESLEPGSRVRTPDLLGYGGNPAWPAKRSITLAEEAACIAPLIVHAPRPVHLVGHSYGAAVATRLALDHPDRVASLALYEPTLFSVVAARPERPAGIEDVVRVAERLAAQLESGDLLAGAETFVSFWGGAEARGRLDDEQRARWRAGRTRRRRISMRCSTRASVRRNSRRCRCRCCAWAAAPALWRRAASRVCTRRVLPTSRPWTCRAWATWGR
ncbi:MAG: alpha/beta fold hydrolase [Gammaproteobacteria bacterium]|nr:alpha/beta fold hydrolase [Gammaproteobacteria bacterium]